MSGRSNNNNNRFNTNMNSMNMNPNNGNIMNMDTNLDQLSEEFLEEQELLLLQQQQYLQQKQLEQQEQELYNRQLLQKQLRQQQQLEQQQKMLLMQQQQHSMNQQQQRQMYQQHPAGRQNMMGGRNAGTNMMMQQQQPGCYAQQQQRQQQPKQQLQQEPTQFVHDTGDEFLDPTPMYEPVIGRMNQQQQQQLMQQQMRLNQQQQQRQQQSIRNVNYEPVDKYMASTGCGGRGGGTNTPLIVSSMPDNDLNDSSHQSNTPVLISASSSTNNSNATPNTNTNMGNNTNTDKALAALTASVLSNTENEKDLWVPPNYEPTNLDICSGRGKAFWNHSGNVTFRNLIQSQVDNYINAPTKAEKSAIVVTIVENLRRDGCKFLKQERGSDGKTYWYDIGDAQARDKVGHSLRDQVTAINRLQKEGGTKSPTPPSPKPVGYASSAAAAALATSSPQPSNVGSAFIANYSNSPQIPINVSSNNNDYNYNNNQGNINLAPMMMAPPPSYNTDVIIANGGNGGVNINIDNGLYQRQGVYQRRPSLSVSDSGNEAEMRRSTLDTSALMIEFGRRPSGIIDSFSDVMDPSNYNTYNNSNPNETEMLSESQRSFQLPNRESMSQQRSAFLSEEPSQPSFRTIPGGAKPKQHNVTIKVDEKKTRNNTTNHKKGAGMERSQSLRGDHNVWDVDEDDDHANDDDNNMMDEQQHDPRQYRKSAQAQQQPNNKRGAGIISSSGTNTNDLITTSIQTFDTTFGDRSGGRTSTGMIMSGASTVRMESSIMRNSTMRFSELSMLSTGFGDMSIANQMSDTSFGQYNSLDESKRFEI